MVSLSRSSWIVFHQSVVNWRRNFYQSHSKSKLKIIFDENVPWPLKQFFHGHEVTSVQREGWVGISNGEVIEKTDGNFDVLLIADKNLRYQQNLSYRSIIIVELPTNRWPILKHIAKRIVKITEQSDRGAYVIVEE